MVASGVRAHAAPQPEKALEKTTFHPLQHAVMVCIKRTRNSTFDKFCLFLVTPPLKNGARYEEKNSRGGGARAGSDTSEVSARTARARELGRRREEFRAATLPYYLRPGGSSMNGALLGIIWYWDMIDWTHARHTHGARTCT